ncbi:MAG: ferritin-like domain-containing protein [Gammaproteobacteria bacterium]|nr:ferritin-like domain-containing protein [Gammaproteobacteria bacterium]|tara:strand:+ start:115 stop:834 length:720 start_codon:yes stop_codon:yes gene_type:complete
MKNPYEKLLNRKRTWTPVQTSAGNLKPGAEETIYRALSIRNMELPVGNYISEALDKDVPDAARVLLESNVKDEERHDLALNYIVNAIGVDENAEKEALRLRAAWEAHPDHTILKALVIERAIFFVILPLFRFNGDAGLRTVSADISRDEQIHVACNSLVCADMGLSWSPSLDKLRKATINWIVQPLGINTTDKYLDKNFWLDASDRLMYEGKAPEFSETQRARMPAFFEHSNVNLPKYA